jgi:hypothetical protein
MNLACLLGAFDYARGKMLNGALIGCAPGRHDIALLVANAVRS